MELQRGVVGDLACIPELGKAVAEAGVIAQTARLLRAARAAGVRVIHCTAAFRRDRMALQEEQTTRLAEQLPLEQICLPYVFSAEIGPAELDQLADRLLAEVEALPEVV